jgi:hypothetical protein
MIIEVTKQVFLIDINDPQIISYKLEEGSNWKVIIVTTFANGFPELKRGDILYKYDETRGYIYNNLKRKFW